MTSDLSLGGVYVPAALVLAVISFVLTALASVLFRTFNLYRFLAHRPIVDLSIFSIIFALLSTLVNDFQPPP